MQDGQPNNSRVLGEQDRLSTISLLDFAHDLRNPLGCMQSALDVLNQDSSVSGQTSDMLAMLQRQLDLLIQLVSAFSDRASLGISEASNAIKNGPDN